MSDFAFDPHNPRCPKCGRIMQPEQIVNSFRYEEQKMTMNIYIHCDAAIGVVVHDDPDPDDPYIIQQV